MYPLKFIPILHDRLWGGTKLNDLLHKPSSSEQVGESWELSAVNGNISVIANGTLKGTSLQEVIDQYGESILGISVYERFGTDFPILIKYIDAKQDLSIQVHPNDDLAKERHDSFGKTEMWYIMDANPGARLIVGFKQDVSKEEYVDSLQNDRLLDLLHYEEVKEGDAFFIDTGKIHAIGAGILLAEIQQTSDITYRVFDFNRRDADGNLRELHTEMALDAIDYSKKNDFKLNYADQANRVNDMVACPFFNTNYIHLTHNMTQDVSHRDSFTIYMCVSGQAEIANEHGTVGLNRGETTLIGANCNRIHIRSSGAKLLEITM